MVGTIFQYLAGSEKPWNNGGLSFLRNRSMTQINTNKFDLFLTYMKSSQAKIAI